MPGISALLDSDMEDNTNFMDENSILSSASEGTDKQGTAPVRKTKKRHRVTMPKPKTKVTKASPTAATRKTTKKVADAKRRAIEAQVDDGAINEVEEDALQETQPKTKARGRPATKTQALKATKGDSADQDNALDGEVEQTPVVARSSHAQSKTARSAPKPAKTAKTLRKQASVAKPAPETQQSEPMDIDTEIDELEVTIPPPPATTRRQHSRPRANQAAHKRAGSASDTERGDPNLRRRLGDVTRKFENIDVKYRQLKEVGIHEASANVEKLRQQCEASTEASNNLIASLKRELAMQAPLANESRKLKKEALGYVHELEGLKNANTELAASLTLAQNEIKALQAKLTAARSHSVESTSGKVPGSAVKGHPGSRMIPVGGSEAAQTAQMKLDLYADLTGLLVHSVKRSEDGYTYDCIQTGRNGTLHFKLFIDHEDAKTASFQETEFLYTPFLDADRDRDMIELMPAYLTEDITFARQNAAKFYQRVVDTLTRRMSDD